MKQLSLLLAAAAISFAHAETVKVVLFPIQSSGTVSTEQLARVNSIFSSRFAGNSKWDIVPATKLDSLLSVRPELAKNPCETECAAAIGQALEVDRVLVGVFSDDAEGLRLQTSLVSSGRKRIVQQEVTMLGTDFNTSLAKVGLHAKLYDPTIIAAEEEPREDSLSSAANFLIGTAAFGVLVGVLYLLL